MNNHVALDDPDLFAPHVKGDTWQAWRAFLAALSGLPADADTSPRHQHHTGRTELPAQAFTEAALICCRRSGKSRTLALIAVLLATMQNVTPHLAPGKRATIAVIAADRKQARTIFQFATGILTENSILADLVEVSTAASITLPNRVTLEIATASFRVTRGYTFLGVLADEVAFWRSDQTSANPDEEILAVIRPGLKPSSVRCCCWPVRPGPSGARYVRPSATTKAGTTPTCWSGAAPRRK